jgi:hypothetical protein
MLNVEGNHALKTGITTYNIMIINYLGVIRFNLSKQLKYGKFYHQLSHALGFLAV